MRETIENPEWTPEIDPDSQIWTKKEGKREKLKEDTIVRWYD